jgi:hypothetical protein
MGRVSKTQNLPTFVQIFARSDDPALDSARGQQ